jgi:hypothetical protein
MKLNDEIRKGSPYRVPEGYFDSLTERTMAAIRKQESRNEAVQAEGARLNTTLIRRMRPFLALAAAIIGFAVMAAVMVRLLGADRAPEGYVPGTSLYADLAFEELDAYMLENELSLTEPVTTEMTEEEISSETIIDYLMTEGIDLNDIYELL